MIATTGKRPSLRRQCVLLSLHRSGLAYHPVPAVEGDLAVMKEIDAIYLRWPFYGSRRMAVELRRRGHDVNRKRIQRLMRVMGLEGMAPGPNTSRPRKEDKKYPYLLRELAVTRPNQVWATDITYIPLRHGFVYLVAIIDWFSRKVLSWRLSNTLDTSFCIEALDEALARPAGAVPEVFWLRHGTWSDSGRAPQDRRRTMGKAAGAAGRPGRGGSGGLLASPRNVVRQRACSTGSDADDGESAVSGRESRWFLANDGSDRCQGDVVGYRRTDLVPYRPWCSAVVLLVAGLVRRRQRRGAAVGRHPRGRGP